MKRFAAMAILMALAPLASFGAEVISAGDLAFLEDMTRAVVAESRVLPDAKVGDIGPNANGCTLIRPGGRGDYPAFWIRDYAMSLESGLIPLEEQRPLLLLTAAKQADADVKLPTGSEVPVGSIPDHIAFGGAPIFYPGILEDYAAQGGKRWGDIPSLDDQFYFIFMASEYVRQGGDKAILSETVQGKPLLERLEAAYRMPPARAGSGIVYCTKERRGVNFGFFDTVVNTGDLFFCSLLKYRAALELAALCGGERGAGYTREAEAIKAALPGLFRLDSGFFKAATETGAQPDVWGTAFAVYIGALAPNDEKAARAALAEALRQGTLSWKGAIRHVPTDCDFSRDSAWEKCYAEKNRYQNGAYWDTPVGWIAYAVCKEAPDAARDLVKEYIAQLREDDFRLGGEHGAPWECRHPDGHHRQNPIYLASVSCPLAAIRKAMTE